MWKIELNVNNKLPLINDFGISLYSYDTDTFFRLKFITNFYGNLRNNFEKSINFDNVSIKSSTVSIRNNVEFCF